MNPKCFDHSYQAGSDVRQDLRISQRSITANARRVLVVVSGGVSESVADAGVDVEVFNWDTYMDAPNATGGVPAHFADLAEPLGVPVGEEVWIDGQSVVDFRTRVERNAAAATLFMQELLDSVETLTSIAEQHGTRTLVDLMYLQAAILDGGFIDHYPDEPNESNVRGIVSLLPSGDKWLTFIV